MRSLIAQLAHASEHGIEEAELLVHLVRVIHIAGMHVHAYDRDLVPFWGAHIGLDPATRIHIFFKSRQAVPLGDHRQCGQQADTGTAFDTADFIHGVQPGWIGDFAGIHISIGDLVENRVDFRLRGANLLHTPHVRRMLARPMHNALAVRRAQAVHIRCRDHNAHGFEPSSAPLRADAILQPRNRSPQLLLPTLRRYLTSAETRPQPSTDAKRPQRRQKKE